MGKWDEENETKFKQSSARLFHFQYEYENKKKIDRNKQIIFYVENTQRNLNSTVAI